jgi:hypothetical protein
VQAATREIIKIKVKACAELQEEVIFQLQQELGDQLEKEASALKNAAPLSTLVRSKMENPTYQCAICFVVFATEHGLRNHTASKLSHLITLCPLCQTFRGFAENDILTHITSGRCQATQGLSKQQVHWMLEAREPHTALCVKVHMWAHGLSDADPGSAVASQSRVAPNPATDPRSSNNGVQNLKYQCPFCEEAFIIPAFLIAHLTGPTRKYPTTHARHGFPDAQSTLLQGRPKLTKIILDPEQTFHCTKPNCPGVFTDALSFFAHTASCAGRPKPPMAPATPIQTPARASRALHIHAPVFTPQMTNQNVSMNFAQASEGNSYRKPGPRRAVPIRNPADKPGSSKPTAQSVPPHLRPKVDSIPSDQTRRTDALPTRSSAVQPGDGDRRIHDATPAHEDPFQRMWLKELAKKNREDQERQSKAAEEALSKARAAESALVNSNIDKIKALANRKKPTDEPVTAQPPVPVVITEQETVFQKELMQEPAAVETLEAGSTWW